MVHFRTMHHLVCVRASNNVVVKNTLLTKYVMKAFFFMRKSNLTLTSTPVFYRILPEMQWVKIGGEQRRCSVFVRNVLAVDVWLQQYKNVVIRRRLRK